MQYVVMSKITFIAIWTTVLIYYVGEIVSAAMSPCCNGAWAMLFYRATFRFKFGLNGL